VPFFTVDPKVYRVNKPIHDQEVTDMAKSVRTMVMNLLDDRKEIYDLPPDRAVVAAYEQNERGNFESWDYLLPNAHLHFKEYTNGFACGDWVARKQQDGSSVK
jgi:hypothetical protein